MADDRSGRDQTWRRPDATDRNPSPRTTIATDISNLQLVALSQNDAAAYYDLVDRNRTHLTRHGDWQDLGEATPESVRADLAHVESLNTSFGVWLDAQLIGRVDLNPRTPGNFVLAYWLGGEFTGKGYATAACQALIAYGKAERGATTIWAGVTKGNTRSETRSPGSELRPSQTGAPTRGSGNG